LGANGGHTTLNAITDNYSKLEIPKKV